MSASDAAPLPRLGEVFFDVRGNSRTMRLSWYADTGVAVFSIWQGGKCTGTFRLPIDDLPRMVEILQRGPESRRPRSGGPGAGRSAGWEPAPPQPDYGQPEPDYGQSYGEDTAYFQDGGYGQDYRQESGYPQERDYGQDPEYGRDRGYPAPPDYSGGPDYGGGTGDYDEAPHYGNDQGYRSQRVVPPYVPGTEDPYRTSNSSPGRYDEPPWSPAGYSEDDDYR
jgi:hypothetical protein